MKLFIGSAIEEFSNNGTPFWRCHISFIYQYIISLLKSIRYNITPVFLLNQCRWQFSYNTFCFFGLIHFKWSWSLLFLSAIRHLTTNFFFDLLSEIGYQQKNLKNEQQMAVSLNQSVAKYKCKLPIFFSSVAIQNKIQPGYLFFFILQL